MYGRIAFTTFGPEGEVGHEVAVHDVDMDPVGAGRVDGAHLLAKPREVGGEDGGGDEGLAHHGGEAAYTALLSGQSGLGLGWRGKVIGAGSRCSDIAAAWDRDLAAPKPEPRSQSGNRDASVST